MKSIVSPLQRWIIVVFCCGYVACSSDRGGVSQHTNLIAKAQAAQRNAISDNLFLQLGETIPNIAESAIKGVVNISSVKVIRYQQSPFFNDPLFRYFFGQEGNNPFGVPRERRQKSLGSGVIVTVDGIVVTSAHVIEGADEVRVKLSDGIEMQAQIVGSDPKTDVAVLRLPKGRQYQALTMGNSDAIRLAEIVLAFGSPFGFQQTVTLGIVSAKGRANVGIVDYEDFIQTDAAINPGNSGGALVSLTGDLIGINTAIYSRSGGYQGIGFAIPINMVKWVVKSFVEKGRLERGWLGIVTEDLNDDLVKALKLNVRRGAVVTGIIKRSPASNKSFRRGDVIVGLSGSAITSSAQFRNRVAQSEVGSTAVLEVVRQNGRRQERLQFSREPEQYRRLKPRYR